MASQISPILSSTAVNNHQLNTALKQNITTQQQPFFNFSPQARPDEFLLRFFQQQQQLIQNRSQFEQKNNKITAKK